MKQKYFFLLTLFTLIFPNLGHSAEKVTTIDSLIIEVWPDFDRASVLFLLTGTLPSDTTLPATVTLPFQKKAELHAIARIDSKDGRMKDDVSYNLDSEKLTFTTPDLRFRLEYYLPYEVNNSQRSFTFNWLSNLTVTDFSIVVQQPKFSSSLTTEPSEKVITKEGNGLSYHNFPKQEVPAGKTFSLKVKYNVTSAELTAAPLSPINAEIQTPIASKPSNTVIKNNRSAIVIGLGAIFIIIILIWKITSRKAKPSTPSTKPSKSKKKSHSKFCHNCGTEVENNSKFCIKCGAELIRKN